MVDILLGADVYYSVLLDGLVKSGSNLPVLQNTQFGWIIAGKVSHTCFMTTTPPKSTNASLCLQTDNIDDCLTRFWSVENIPDTPISSPEDQLAETIFKETTRILPNGSYQINMPLKSDTEYLKLGESFSIARKRFLNLENRFKKDKQLFFKYKSFIDEYLKKGYGRYIPLELQNEYNENKYYIPHHCVLRENNATTKLRVVYDASCKSSTNISLNDITLKGFTVQPELYDILNRFRASRFVMTCDIEKMYLQIKLNPSQTFLQNIIWRENDKENFKCIELLTVIFGTKFAPYIATRVLKDVALRCSESHPLASNVLLNSTYLDDILCPCNTYEELLDTSAQLKSILNSAGFKLHKYCSNVPNLIEVNLMSNNYEIKPENCSDKVLGLIWNSSTDYFCIQIPDLSPKANYTKREVLSKVSQMYDPLGFVNPVIVIGKYLMQQIWLSRITWDENLPQNILLEWKRFVHDLPCLSQLRIPRYLFNQNKILSIELHGFSDASSKAYGACCYVRAIYEDNSLTCNLITAKSRIAPIKTVSLPRLELCGMVILAKLINRVISIFSDKLNFRSINLWSDSQVALCWIKSHPSRWTTFVANRVSQIQSLTAQAEWRYVKSPDNPADILSRGMSPKDLQSSDLWFHGPDFLQNIHVEFDTAQLDQNFDISNLPEERRIVNVTVSSEFWINLFQKFSSFTRLHRTLTWCLRFTHNIKAMEDHELSGGLIVSELQKLYCSFGQSCRQNGFPKNYLN